MAAFAGQLALVDQTDNHNDERKTGHYQPKERNMGKMAKYPDSKFPHSFLLSKQDLRISPEAIMTLTHQ
ncbi:MAG: hypothetical protein WC831_01345 [Parcubacteria group bacterium]